MSLATWKKEFCPAPASECEEKDALAHVLRKYLGTRQEALEQHGVEKKGNGLIDRKGHAFWFGVDTCALCMCYSSAEQGACSKCPLTTRGGKRCFNHNRPYRHWCLTGDPEPMIRALRRAIKKQERKGTRPC